MPRSPHPKPNRSQTKQIPIYGKASWNFGGLEALPSPFANGWPRGWVDPEVREQMLQHPKVYQNINNLKAAIIGNGGRVIPNVAPSHPRFEIARKNAELCAYALRHIEGSWHGTARQMLDAVHECHKVAPKEFREQENGQFKNFWLLNRLPVLPNRAFRFLRDAAGNVPKLRVSTFDDKNKRVQKDIDRNEFAVLTFRPFDNSPWGTTVCSPAYEPWYTDVQIDPEEMAMVAQFGRPSVVVIAPGVVDGVAPAPVPLWNGDGSAHMDPSTGQQKSIPVAEAIAQNLSGYEAGSGLVLPGNSQFQLAQAQGGGDVFRFIREKNARYIASAIMGTHQLTESERQASTNNQAAAEGTVGLGVTDGKRALEEMVENDLFVDLVRFNYGESALDFLPIFDLGSAQNGRLAGLMNAVAGYINNGAFDKTQWWHYCAEVGLPLPDAEADPVVEPSAARGNGGAQGNTANESSTRSDE